MLTDERRSARHPGAASVQLHGTARHCRLLCQSLRALKSCATLAPSPPHSRRVMPGHVLGALANSSTEAPRTEKSKAARLVGERYKTALNWPAGCRRVVVSRPAERRPIKQPLVKVGFWGPLPAAMCMNCTPDARP
eukprot:scaffold91492_cov72-Phaeocystis_antarctica.AAC.5